MKTFKCRDISNKYNGKDFLKDISFELNQCECLGIIGDNGSGKSTLMSICAGILSPFSGDILLNDDKITRELRAKIGYVPQTPSLIEYLTAHENLKLWQSIFKVKNLDNIPDFLGISDFYNKKVSDLSGGMQKKLSIAISLINQPDFLILDEAFSALDKKTSENMINYLKSQEIGILYSSHSVYEITELCSKVLVLKNGKIVYNSCEFEDFSEENIRNIYSKF